MSDFKKAYDYINDIIHEYEGLNVEIEEQIEYIRFAQTTIDSIRLSKENLLRRIELQKVIELTGVSQRQFATMIGVYPQFISQMLRPDRKVPEKHLYKIWIILKQQMELENQPTAGDNYVGENGK